jgi:versiconal hemiacetal acetate reductase
VRKPLQYIALSFYSNNIPAKNSHRVGSSGLKVSKVVLGCMTYGDQNWQPWVLPLEESVPIMKYAYDQGINTFDIADAYSNGHSEQILGAFLKKYNIKRSSIVIMTKIFFRVDEKRGAVDPVGQQTNDGSQVNQVGLSRKHICDAVDASIARLGTHIDVLQIHRLDRDTPMEEIMRGLNDVVESGKARYLGASSVSF